MSTSMNDFNQQVIEELHANGGDRLSAAQSERVQPFAEYEQKTDCVIPVIVLTPAGT
jgi:hypothetical protein